MSNRGRRQLLLAAPAFAALRAVPAFAQARLPSGALHLTVPYAAGGSLDFVARVIAPRLSSVLGQPVVVENWPGGGSIIGSARVARAKPDGDNILLSGSTITMQPSLVKSLSYDVARDFEPVSLLVTYGLTLTVNVQVPAKTLPEFLAYARDRGSKMFYGSPGIGTTPHMAGELFNSVAGTQMTHIPYKGNGPMMTALLSGDVQAGFDTISGSKPFVDEGKVRVLALTGNSRSTVMPQVPTAAEAGLPKFELEMWQGLFLPKDTPAAIVAKWNDAVRQTLADPAVAARLVPSGYNVAPSSAAQMKATVSAELARWPQVAKVAGIKPV